MSGKIEESRPWRGGQWICLGLVGLAITGWLPFTATAARCQAQSGPMQTALIELYTSEGCSSCPPADRWLADLATQPSLNGKIVPLALHVDYWDRLGWCDRFAQPGFSARQRTLTAGQGSTTVFTPQVMINGHTTLDWNRDTVIRQSIATINAQPAKADLTLEILPAPGAWRVQIQGRLQPRLSPIHTGVFAALYQNGLSSRVTAGENAARQLHHERVTRELIGPLPVAADGRFAHDFRFRRPSDADSHDLGVAAFIQDQTDGHVWQALALTACRE